MFKKTVFVIADENGNIFNCEDGKFTSNESDIINEDCLFEEENSAYNKLEEMHYYIQSILSWVKSAPKIEFYENELKRWQSAKIHKVIFAAHCDTLASANLEG